MHGELEPEEHVLPDEDPSEGGKVYPVTPSTTQLLGDVSKAIYDAQWSFNDTFEVSMSYGEALDNENRFLIIKNLSIETNNNSGY